LSCHCIARVHDPAAAPSKRAGNVATICIIPRK
jgi:hypothetical protein